MLECRHDFLRLDVASRGIDQKIELIAPQAHRLNRLYLLPLIFGDLVQGKESRKFGNYQLAEREGGNLDHPGRVKYFDKETFKADRLLLLDKYGQLS